MNFVLLDELSRKGTILTPTRRLAGHCLKAIAKARQTSSRIFETPPLYSLSDWTKRCWEQYEMKGAVTKLLLTPTQSLLACEEIIVNSSVGNFLVDSYQTAKRVYSAWNILHQWRSLDLLDREYDQIDYQAFVEWMKIYTNYLTQHNYIDEAMLPQANLDILIKSEPETLIFYGFEEKTPFLAYFLETLGQHGWQILWESSETVVPDECYRCAFVEKSQEQVAAVQFAKEQYEKGKKNIAIVVPDLADERQQLEKLLREAFDPLAIAAPWVEVDPHFNISAAIPLIQYPIVCMALDKLRTKPFSFSEEKPYTAWAEHFRQILVKQQWPGYVALTSIEYQSMIRFDRLLQELSECDRVLSPCRYQEALSTVEKLASYIPFQPENRNAPIQVLGVLEAAGQTFDAIWIMGMQNEAWPPPAKHNPFIELEAQRQRGMPHASAEREIQYALSMTNRFKESAREVIFSYATQNKERKWEVSELIRDLPLNSNRNVIKEKIEKITPEIPLELIKDETSKNLVLKSTYSTRVLELQASCPFRAFAEYRLGVKPPLEETKWLTPSDQGIMLHTILEKFWKKESSQNNLKAMSSQDREKKISLLIKESLDEWSLPPSYKEAEYTRLMIILKDYMALETERGFFRIIKTEYRKTYTLGGMTFKLRCDRIEEDETGAQWIVDYKTGKFNESGWMGPRMAAPQLPLYALAYETPQLSGIRVIRLLMEGCEFIDPHQEKDFHSISQTWRIELETLARSFVAQEAGVDPKNAAACLYCHLQSLCRIREQEVIHHG